MADRLEGQFRTAPSEVIQAALELARRGDAESQSRLVAWVHHSLAAEFVPTLTPRARDGFYDDLLTELATRNPYTAMVTEGLRMWREAKAQGEALATRRLLSVRLPVRDGYGPRYQLLLLDLLDKQADAAMRAEIEREWRLLADSLTLTRGEYAGQPLSDAARYWIAYASSRQVRKGRPEVSRPSRGAEVPPLQQVNAFALAGSLSDRVGPRKNRPWCREAEALGGPSEFLTPVALDCEARGRDDCALSTRLELAKLEPETLPVLAAAFERTRAPAAFEEYWEQERWKGAPILPRSVLDKTGLSAGTWSLIVVSSETHSLPPVDRQALEGLLREYPNQVANLTIGGDGVQRDVPSRAMVWATGAAGALLDLLDLRAVPAILLARPDRSFVTLALGSWLGDARRHLAR